MIEKNFYKNSNKENQQIDLLATTKKTASFDIVATRLVDKIYDRFNIENR